MNNGRKSFVRFKKKPVEFIKNAMNRAKRWKGKMKETIKERKEIN